MFGKFLQRLTLDAFGPRTKQGASVATTTQTLTLVDNTDPVNGGANYTYTAQYTNTGSNTANTVSVAVTLDPKLTYVSATGTGWSISQVGGVVTCTVAAAAVGAAPAITITVTAPNDGTTLVTSSGQATAANAPTANSGNQTTTVTPQTTQTVSVTPSVSNTLANRPVNYTYAVQYTNTGTNTANTVSVAVTIHSSLTYVSSSGTGWSFSGPTGGVLTCTRATALAGAAPSITITVSPGAAATATTSAVASASNAANANGSSTVNVLACSKDATSGIYCPATATEWSNVMTVAGIGSGGPSALWLCQDLSGNLADAIGAFPATASGTGLGYQAAVTGWSRKAVTTTDGSTGKFFSTSTSLPDGASASVLTIAYVNVTGATTANRTVLRNINTTAMEVEVTTTPRAKVIVGAASTTGTNNPTTAGVMPWVIKHNFTASAQAFYDLQEKLIPTFTALSGKLISIGAGAGNSTTAQYLMAAHFFNGAAELSDAQVKTLLQTLNWTIPWS